MRATILALTLVLGAVASAAAPAAHEQAAALSGGSALTAFDTKIDATKQAMMGDPSVARKAAEEAVRMAEAMRRDAAVSPRDAAVSLATAQWLLGEAMIGLNDAPHAKSLIAEALAGVEAHDRGSKLHGDLLRSRATLAEMSGDVQGALKDYLAAHRIFQAGGEKRAQAIALQDIGNLYLEAGDFDRVRKYYSESLEAYGDDPWLNLATYNNRGQSYREQKRYREAEAEYRLALKAARQLRSPLLEARILTNLAETQSELGQLDPALQTLDAAGALVRGGEGAGWRPFVFGVRAMVEAKRGNTAEAGRLMGTAFAGQDLSTTEMPFRELHQAAAQIYEKLGDREQALAHLKAFQRLDREALRLTASASAQLMAAQFDFANQDLRIAQLKQGQLQRDITIERQRGQFRTRLFTGLGSALLIIFGLLAFGYVSIRRSRDQVRATNTELSSTNVALEKALKARTDFLATTSHEIRTQLNGILGMSQVLLADRRLASDTRERIELLRGAGETMKVLVDDILDVAKMEAGELAVDTEEVDLSRLLNGCVGLWREAAANKGLALECVLDRAPARVVGDGARLRQILSNLLSNAIKFTPEGAVTLDVRSDGSGIHFAVRDTGIGIPEDDQGRIFEAFTQVNNSTTREYSGTGLGLAISQRLAQAMGGGIALTSAPGEGSCFTLSLPLQAVGDGFAQLAAASGSLADAAVLLVERNIANHALMRMLLTPETRSIDIACSVEDALAQMAEAHFDHIVIEGASAGGAGRSAIEGIRMLVAQARPANAHTSLLAAASEELGAAQMFAAGADQVILKPIGAAELIAQLKKLYEAAEPAAEPSEPPLRQAAG
jgi:signal transduction histidine kinase